MWAAQICLYLLLSCVSVTESSALLRENESAAESIIKTEFDSIDGLFSHLSDNWPPFNQIINRETNHYFCLNEDCASLAKSQLKNLFEGARDGEASALPTNLPQLLLQVSNNTNYVVPDMKASSICSLLQIIAVLKKNETAAASLGIFEKKLFRKALLSPDMSSKRLSYACSRLLSLDRTVVLRKMIRLFHDNIGTFRFQALEMRAHILNFRIFFLCAVLAGRLMMLNLADLPYYLIIIIAIVYAYIAWIFYYKYAKWYYTVF